MLSPEVEAKIREAVKALEEQCEEVEHHKHRGFVAKNTAIWGIIQALAILRELLPPDEPQPALKS